MSNQCYHNGDFWQCDTATTAGESPTTTPAKWRKIKLPGKWRWVLAQLTYAQLLEIDGQTDKANGARSVAYGRDRVGLDELIRQEANEENKRDRCGGRGRSAGVNTGATRPVAASVILDDAYRLIGWDADQLDDREKQDARKAISQAVQEVWEAWWWHELMVMTVSTLAPLATYNYLADAVWVEQPAGRSYFSITTLTAGVQYRLVAADINEFSNGYSDEGGGLTVPDDGGAVFDGPGEQVFTPAYTGGIARFWSSSGSTSGPVQDELYVRALALSTAGPVRSVSKFDPRASSNPVFYELDVTEDATRVLNLDVSRPWIWSRRVTPIITGDEFDATVTYEATDPEDLVYDA